MAMKSEDILAAILTLPPTERLQLVEQVVHSLASESRERPAGAIVGLFADEPDLIDEVAEGAMLARERDHLRV
jgi:hypothetical protein